MAQLAVIDTLRSLGEADISASYAAVGSPTTSPTRIICITNNTNGDMYFSTDGVNDMLFVAKSSFKLFDITTNKQALPIDDTFVFATNTQWYVRQSTMASSGAVYIEIIYGK